MSLAERIKLLDDKKKELISKRKAQIATLAEKAEALDLDDATIAIALLFIKHKPHHPILKEMKHFAEEKGLKLTTKSNKTINRPAQPAEAKKAN